MTGMLMKEIITEYGKMYVVSDNTRRGGTFGTFTLNANSNGNTVLCDEFVSVVFKMF